jgi:outer membrane protein OmpA-like peptidoglycan-associated protein
VRSFILIAGLSLVCLHVAAQQKLPALSFQDKSLQFANSNQIYRQGSGGTESDTLNDQLIVQTLSKILLEHPELQVELAGHTAVNEPEELGLERAELVHKMLVERGVDDSRLSVMNHGHSQPIIPPDVIFSFITAEEKYAANAKNRRVEVRVVSNTFSNDADE